MKVWHDEDFTPARLLSQCISVPLWAPPFQKTQIFPLFCQRNCFLYPLIFCKYIFFLCKDLLIGFINLEAIFQNLSPAGTEELTEVSFFPPHFPTLCLTLDKGK